MRELQESVLDLKVNVIGRTSVNHYKCCEDVNPIGMQSDVP